MRRATCNDGPFKNFIRRMTMNMQRETTLKMSLALMLPLLWTATLATADAGTPRAATSTVSRTGPAGKTATRQAAGSYNAATNTYSRSAVTTGPNGRSVSSSGQATYNPATGTVKQSRTSTGPNGRSATESRSVSVAAGQPTGA
jgi:hypothetical protein